MSRNFYLYPVWVRLWHLANAILCIILMVTGLQMGLYDPVTDAADRFQTRVSIHNISGILLTVSYMIFFFGNIFTRNGKHYRARVKGSAGRIMRQLHYYLGGRARGEEVPFPADSENKFNPLQKMTYAGTMYLIVPLLIITGWIMMYPASIIELFPAFNIYAFTDILHIVLAVMVSLFVVVHLTVTIAGRDLRSIITGWKENR
jgi:thiosulfate reductase cytochrome b subunit